MLGRVLLVLLGFAAIGSFGTLGGLIVSTSPDGLIARFLFFVLQFAAVFFASVLLVHYVSLRTAPSSWSGGVFRISVLCGIPPAAAAGVAMWLQSLRALGPASGLILLGAVALMELAIIVNGRKSLGDRRVQEAGR